MTTVLSWSPDLSSPAVVLACAVALVLVLALGFELRRSTRAGAGWVFVSGLVATSLLVLTVLRPARIETDGVLVGPRVVVLVDVSRSMLLEAEEQTRIAVAQKTLKLLGERDQQLRTVVMGFGSGAASDLSNAEELRVLSTRSDLVAGLESLSGSGQEPPRAVIVISDGRLDRPTEQHAKDASALGMRGLSVPVHTVAVTQKSQPDASVRSVRLAGAAVAHQPLSLRIEVGCSGDLVCERVPVVVREVVDEGAAVVLARGEAAVAKNDSVTVEFSATLHRAGARVLEVGIEAPSGDRIAENDRRYITLDVARDRVRILHIAGRPTYDVRALRTYLKQDESIDVVAFFILRTPTDNVGAAPSELALIPFPVDELFSVHLPSFDAVVLQDFNADVYGLTKHTKNLAEYVGRGGGLIMVGGPDAFGPGQYAGTALSQVLPVKLTRDHAAKGVDLGWFEPTLTPAGRAAPVLSPLRDIVGEAFPEMPGTNLVGAGSPGATVLLSHPTLGDAESRMPVLALGEFGTGRTIALTVDGTHRLLFSSFAAERAGRAYGAFWDGLLGWLMRDPRYESTSIDVTGGCIAGEPGELVVRALPGATGNASLRLLKLGSRDVVFEKTVPIANEGQPTRIALPALVAGGYAASVRVGGDAADQDSGLTPATRRDFACEKGGDEWADSRPDPARLQLLAKATGGVSVTPERVSEIPLPKAALVSTQRKVIPLLPPWALSGLSALVVGLHWILRRKSGLA